MLSKRILHKLADICIGLANSCCLVCAVAVPHAHMCLVLSMSSQPTPLCSQQAVVRLNSGGYVRGSAGKNAEWFGIYSPPFCHCYVECWVVSHLKNDVCLSWGGDWVYPKTLLILCMGCSCSPWSKKNLFFLSWVKINKGTSAPKGG